MLPYNFDDYDDETNTHSNPMKDLAPVQQIKNLQNQTEKFLQKVTS